MPELRVVFLDNVDSFTYNLVDEFARRGVPVEVFRNDRPAEAVVGAATRSGPPTLLALSPGPGTPASAGSCLEVIRRAAGRVPIFGICLGHQAMVEAFGGSVGPAAEVLHGKSSTLTHRGGPLFDGLPRTFPVARYHSLAATRVPDSLEVSATAGAVVMAVQHRALPALGVQFHPESVLTPAGGRIIDNVIRWASHAGQ